MLLPYRVKNPPLRFPYVTIALIVINVVVYLCTTEMFLVIKESVVENWAVTHNNINILRLVSAMFLHAGPTHILGNMLFLWIFGQAVEGRLGIPLYLGLYVTTGFAGSLCHDFMSGVLNPDMPSLGASGAIMGLMGAYLYLSPFAQVLVFWWVRFRAGVATWQAQWVIGMYAVIDIAEGFLYRGTPFGGTANFAHLGGMGAGFLLLLASGMTRESEDYAEAQAARADMGGNLLSMNQFELQSLMEGPSNSPAVVLAYARKTLSSPAGNGGKLVLEAFTRYSQMLIDRGDPEQIALVALQLPVEAGRLPGPFLLRLAGRLEQNGNFALAERAYHLLLRGEGAGSEIEMGLARLARLVEQTNPDKGQAAAIYAELLRRFPDGPQAPYARQAIQRLGQPTVTFSPGNAPAVPAAPAAPAPLAPAPLGHPAPPPLGGVGGLAPVASAAGAPAAQPGPAAPAAPAMPSMGGIGGLGSVGLSPGNAPQPAAAPASEPPAYAGGGGAASLLRPIGSTPPPPASPPQNQ